MNQPGPGRPSLTRDYDSIVRRWLAEEPPPTGKAVLNRLQALGCRARKSAAYEFIARLRAAQAKA